MGLGIGATQRASCQMAGCFPLREGQHWRLGVNWGRSPA